MMGQRSRHASSQILTQVKKRWICQNAGMCICFIAGYIFSWYFQDAVWL
jgi:hypothetical protein